MQIREPRRSRGSRRLMYRLGLLMVCVAFALALTACGGSGGGDDSKKAKNEEQPDPNAIAFSEIYDAYADKVDLEFAKEVNEKVASFGDDEALGMRSAGSPAEKETCDYLEGVMEDIGLENVTVDEFTTDGWTFNGANITFTNADGKEQKIDLGGYQTQLQAKDEEIELIDVKKGTEADYEKIDAAGKLVLLDIDQENEWWINYPAYQAKVKGAKAVIAMRIFEEEGPDRVGVQDICGPADAPALAISEQDATALREAIKKSGKDSIKVRLNADSTVEENVTSHNLYGEIPGKVDGTIFVFSHMDGYFHAAYDDAQGVAVSMAMAKAMVDSGFTPEKTIRFCIHGAEEWGREGSEYDWSVGAYEEIMTNHPEWIPDGFAIINNDGGYTVEGEDYNGINCSPELRPFVKNSTSLPWAESKYEWKIKGPSTGTEDFQWIKMGIPTITASGGDAVNYDAKGYHSTYDSWEAQPLDEEGMTEVIRLYGKIAFDLDALKVRPMSFTTRLKAIEKTYSDAGLAEMKDALAEAKTAAAAMEKKMEEIEASGEQTAAVEMNAQSQEVYKVFQDTFLGLDFINVDAIERHQMYQDNIENLQGAIDALEKGDVKTAYDDYLSSVDWSWYDMYFDEETCDYMKNQLFEKRDDTWGKDMIKYPHADTRDVVVSLRDKYDDPKADVKDDIEALKELKATQEEYLTQVYADEKKGLAKATKLMNAYGK